MVKQELITLTHLLERYSIEHTGEASKDIQDMLLRIKGHVKASTEKHDLRKSQKVLFYDETWSEIDKKDLPLPHAYIVAQQKPNKLSTSIFYVVCKVKNLKKDLEVVTTCNTRDMAMSICADMILTKLPQKAADTPIITG